MTGGLVSHVGVDVGVGVGVGVSEGVAVGVGVGVGPIAAKISTRPHPKTLFGVPELLQAVELI